MRVADTAEQPEASFRRLHLAPSTGVVLEARKWGNAVPRFLFLHGFGEGSFVWDHVVPCLLPHGSVVAVDLRGHGESGHDPAHAYSTQVHLSDVSAVLRALCPNPILIVGHSLGAELAMHLAVAHRLNILGAVLVDGGPQLNAEAIAHLRHEFSMQPWHYRTIDEYVRHLEAKFPLTGPSLLHAIAPHALRDDSMGGYRLKCDRAMAQHLSDRTGAEALWPLFRSISCPVLVVRGAGSAVLPQSTAARMIREGQQCALETVPLAGHAVMLDNPSGFLAALRGFVSRVGRLTNERTAVLTGRVAT